LSLTRQSEAKASTGAREGGIVAPSAARAFPVCNPPRWRAAMAETKQAKSASKSSSETASVGILGASGYTGAELVRLLLRHPKISIDALTGDRRAGQPMASVFPHFSGYDLPKLVTIDELDASGLDVVFCALPHGTTQ